MKKLAAGKTDLDLEFFGSDVSLPFCQSVKTASGERRQSRNPRPRARRLHPKRGR